MTWNRRQRDRLQLVGASLLFLLLAGVGLGAPTPVLADPHAIFYTAIGQQQLFFNVIAALDQADYVEPYQGNFSRDELVGFREAVNAEPSFGPEDDPIVTATRTRLAALLTRDITLDGDDRYTSEIVRDLSGEIARRRGLSELARAYCQYAFGIRYCDREFLSNDSAGAAQDAALDESRAYIVNPVKDWLSKPFTDGLLAVLDSGTKRDQKERDSRLSGSAEKNFPYAHGPSIELWRYLADKLPPAQGVFQAELIDNLLIPVLRESISQDSRSYPYGLLVGSGSNIGLQPQIEIVDGVYQYKESNIGGLGALGDLGLRVAMAPAQVAMMGAAGASRIAQQQGLLAQDGFTANGRLFSWRQGIPQFKANGDFDKFVDADPDQFGYWGEVSALITNPAKVRSDAAGRTFDVLIAADESSYASAATNVTPGRQYVNERGLFDSSSGNNPFVLGPLDPSAGQVAGIVDNFNADPDTGFFGDKVVGTRLSPDSNLIVPHLDQGFGQALKRLTDDSFRAGGVDDGGSDCGYTC